LSSIFSGKNRLLHKKDGFCMLFKCTLMFLLFATRMKVLCPVHQATGIDA
jgi:hypothetical protein